MNMRCIRVEADVLTLTQSDTPTPKPDEVLVKVSAFGINRADLLQRDGNYPPPPGASDILGLEVAGEVVECGSGCDSRWQGRRVAAMLAGGGYAEYVTIPLAHLICIPEQLTDAQFAAVPEVYLTVIQSLVFIAKLQPGHKVLIHAGASGVGSAGMQLVKALGGKVAVTCSSGKVGYCQQLGADLVVDYQTDDFESELKAQKFYPDIILDVVGENYLNKNINIVNQDGHIVQLAMMKGRYSEPLDLAKLLGKRVNIHGSTLRNRDDQYKSRLVDYFNQEVLPLFVQKKLDPAIDRIFAITDIEQAHSLMRNNQTKGKLVVTW
ncbi:MAG: NAD(P)H-quinone oxidoreductase [Aestuariibacter sp.]